MTRQFRLGSRGPVGLKDSVAWARRCRGPHLVWALAVGCAGLPACGADQAPAQSGGAEDAGADAGRRPPDAAARSDAAANGDDGGSAEVTPQPADDAEYLFDQQVLRTYNLVVDPDDLAAMDADPTAEQYVEGSLEFEGETYGPVGIRYKGSIGAFLSPCTASSSIVVSGSRGPRTGKCSFKVDFNRVDRDLRFFGLKKLNFHSMNIDPSLMRDRLGYMMFREFGIAAPRAMHARLLVNGELRGLYIVVEQIDGRFTKRRFHEGGDGNVYKEVWPESTESEPYRVALRTNEDANPSVQGMVDFAKGMAAGEDVSGWIDPEYMRRYLAVDRVIVHDDGPVHSYCGYRHNFYWYQAEAAARFWIIPWDLDAAYALRNNETIHIEPVWNAPATDCGCSFSGGGVGIPAACDGLWGQFVEQKDAYERTVDEFLVGPYAESNVSPKLEAWGEQIDPVVQETSGLDGATTYEQWQRAYATFKDDVATTRERRGFPYE